MLQWTISDIENFSYVGFNGHPPLGVNATLLLCANYYEEDRQFQWAPTLGGECYRMAIVVCDCESEYQEFQWAPTLGGECYITRTPRTPYAKRCVSMGTHPWG